MRIKDGVKINGVRPEIVLALQVIDPIYTKYSCELVVTEITGGTHGRNSLHYVGLAADIRTRDFKQEDRLKVVAEIKDALGAQFDVILESTHIHIEYQPE